MNWRERKAFYVQLELLTNAFFDEMLSVIPVVFTFMNFAAVGCLVLAIKLTGISPIPWLILVAVTLMALDLVISTFVALKITESIGTESMGLLGELQADAFLELKKKRFATLLTKRRFIRPRIGNFMFIESGRGVAREGCPWASPARGLPAGTGRACPLTRQNGRAAGGRCRLRAIHGHPIRISRATGARWRPASRKSFQNMS